MKNHIVKSFAIGAVIISALVMGFIMYELSITKQDIATQIITQNSERIRSKLNAFFIPIRSVMSTLQEQNEIRNIRDLDRNSLNKFYIPIITEYPQISSIGIAHSSGYELDLLPDSIKGYWLNREVRVDEWGMIEKWIKWKYDDDLVQIRSWETPLKVDPRERSWFKGAASNPNKEIYWTEPYEYMTGSIGITSSSQFLYNDVEQSYYIMALDITLNDLTNFSRALTLSTESEIFILTGDKSLIIGLPDRYSAMSIEELFGSQLLSPEEFGNEALLKLLEYDSEQIVSFTADDIKWWGVLKKYSIAYNQDLVVATLIPERDFSAKIDRTSSLMFMGFLFVLALSSLLVRNNRKLRQAGESLTQKNIQINHQKQHLLAEVHHRVKNNLAIMSALMELENMMIDDPKTNLVLNLIQSRILSMSAVHEVLYKSDKYNQIQVQEILPGITNYFKNSNPEINVESRTQDEPVQINVNQALTYALLINEFMNYIKKSDNNLTNGFKISINVKYEAEYIVTEISTNQIIDLIQDQNDIAFELIHVLIEQLDAYLTKMDLSEGVAWKVGFKLDDKKGITSDKNFQD